ncbi:hypothetical protein KQY30_18120 [Streptomyces sp. GMY02]|uniref:hypothetical protein n=1 Tax=Streptomyces sp. GMY02 TaxID=1333528 RepID=UPI001C2C4ABD|nr:hypothetical protein [Streptomyces sp. GMY02]QXE35892.1 hypothetical protein KQY30_18120 [Streptomyces sp. GMY02]
MSQHALNRHVVMWSGGITSWATARMVIGRYGRDNVTLLFADTNSEDPDLHRFNQEAVAKLGGQIVRVADPKERNIWDVFEDDRFLGNARLANCSKYLKQVPSKRWVAQHTNPADTTLHIGIDWTETHRIQDISTGWAPWRVEYPLTEPPLYDKDHWIAEARRDGLEPVQTYDLGFPHANCGGGCVRAGQGQWARLLVVFPDRYAYAEEREERLRQRLRKDVAILRDRRGGELKPLTLRQFRQRLEAAFAAQPGLRRLLEPGTVTTRIPPAITAAMAKVVDLDDVGGCGCFTATEQPSSPDDPSGELTLFDAARTPEQMSGVLPYTGADTSLYSRALAGDGYGWLSRILPPPAPLSCPRCRRPTQLGTVPLLWECPPCDTRDEGTTST